MSNVINAFPGYEFVNPGPDGKPHNIYKGEDVGFGGYVWAAPGMYGRTVCYDVSGMHPASIRALNCFGDYTANFGDLVDARLAIKHKDFDKARTMLDGKLAPYLDDENQAKDLAKALKIAVNSVYGLTSASFDNPFRDLRNKNNIVALRGALFISDLKREIQSRGYTVIHCKTDSIKVVDPSKEIENFIMEYGEKYGYQFEIEHIFEKICLVNDAVYIAKLAADDPEKPGKWTATGTQFQVPYVFKKLFSKEEITFKDICETKSVTSDLYLDMNEDLPDVSDYEKEYQKLWKDINNKDLPNDEEMKRKCERVEELRELIDKGHNYRFIGKVGQFCPIKEGCGGGLLMREKDGKYYAATGSKGYRWLESEMVKELKKEADIDYSYYDRLVNDAVETISKYGDFEWFVSDDLKPDDDRPPWVVPCGNENIRDCFDCKACDYGSYSPCELGYEIVPF
jgi:DNA polymerase elongation subunit (family B)